MNEIIDNFPEILDFAKGYGLPISKKRAILREYLQSKILNLIYQNKLSLKLIFIGGTSLRLLHNLDRFSEDMDFDVDINHHKDIPDLISSIYNQLKKENIEVELYKNITANKTHFEFRFLHLLDSLHIGKNKEEKLMIKFDFEYFWQGYKKEILLLNRYGFLINVISTPLNQILVQKLYAYLNRGQTLARDLYDIVWLISHNAKIDGDFAKKNKISMTDLIEKIEKKYLSEKNKLNNLKARLKPFLVNENNINKLDLFQEVLISI